MMKLSRGVGLGMLLMACAFMAVRSSAQTTSATLAGRATVQGKAAQGVSVTVTSPALQGARAVTTGPDGEYSVVALPPGPYVVSFELAGLQPAARSIRLNVADAGRIDVELTPAALSESVTVQPTPLSVLSSPQVSTNLGADLVELLPMGRTIIDMVLIAGGVQNTGPLKQPIINGAPSYDNLYLVDGVTINEQTRGQPHKLFIDDAIQETTILTAGISAEYGRFTGGVVNVITKSGGNQPTGSLRDSLSSDRWTARTPYAGEAAHLHVLNHDYEGTLGGRIVRDRLWFFLAGRYDRRQQGQQTLGTAIPFTHGTSEDRYEAKVTAALTPRNSLVGSWIDVRQREHNVNFGTAADLQTLYDSVTPNSLLALYYTGIARQDTVFEAQFSRKRYTLSGGNSNIAPGDLVNGTPAVDQLTSWLVGAPIFCARCGTSSRDNRDLLVKGSYFLGAGRYGDHTIVAGIDDFHDLTTENAHQSASDFMIDGTVVNAGSRNLLQMVPGESFIEYFPILFPGDRAADYTTRSAFVNDRVILGTRVTLNLGLRYDANRGHDALGALQADDSRFSPRIGATWDLRGDGAERVNASFSRYASKAQQVIGASATAANSPADIVFVYQGPEINVDPTMPVATPDAIRQVFDWFQSVGGVKNTELMAGGVYPGATQIRGHLASPIMDEYTVGYGHQFSDRGLLRADYIHRRWSDFYVKQLTTANGTLTSPYGDVADRVFITNGNAGLARLYRGVVMQGAGRWRNGFLIGGNYTWSKLTGNVEGETGGSSVTPVQDPAAYLPEYFAFAQNSPMGYLSGDVRHRANVWAGWEIPAALGRFALTLLQRYQSARSYSVVTLADVRKIRNPGYAGPPSFASYYLFGRGQLRVDPVSSTGIGLNFLRSLAGYQLFAEADLENIFNQHAIEDPSFIDRSSKTARTDRNLATFNPFTATQLVACPRGVATSSAQCKGVANYQLGNAFGQPTAQQAYQTPRTIRLSFGVRF